MSSTRRNRHKANIGHVENLEGRELMTGGGIYGLNGQYINKFDYQKLLEKRANPPAPVSQRRVEIAIPEYGPRAKVVFTLYGPGTIMGDPNLTPGTDAYNAVNTHIDGNNQFHILFDGTTSESQIIGTVTGTRRNPKIAEIRDVDVAPFNTTGVGTNQMGYVNLARFDLAPGGRVNFSAGVQRIFLNNIGPSTQLDLAALPTPPLTSPQNPGGFNSTTTSSSSGSNAVTNTTGQKTITQTVNGITVITTLPTTDQLTVSNGELTGVGGITLPGAIPSTTGNTRVEVQGVELIVKSVAGANNPLGQPQPRLGNEYIAGVDGANDKLVLFNVVRDTTTNAITANYSSEITVPTGGTPLVGSAIGEYNGLQVVTVGFGQTVMAYNVLNGAYVGQFDTSNLSATGFTEIDGIGGSSGDIFISDSINQLIQPIDLTASLNSGQAVAAGSQFTLPDSFYMMTGVTGAAGISYIYTVGTAYFNPWTPQSPTSQLGIMKLNVSATETLSVNTSAKISNTVAANPYYAMGSVDQNLILFTPDQTVTDGYQTQNMYDPDTLASSGTIKFQYSGNLSGLSESFYPDLLGASVIDVKGNLKTFSANSTDNMVLNVNGIANYTRINRASNSTIIAHPVLHLAVSWMPNSNVDIISSSRPTNETPGGKTRPGTRGGVRIIKNLPVLGPYTNPLQQG
ncbi:MAG: hypothetical protein RJA81_385 [Planctomycetota bacterium]